jgi:CHRD domain
MNRFSAKSVISAIEAFASKGGNMYGNVHTAKYPDGEIRGQVTLRVRPGPCVVDAGGRASASKSP